MAARAAITDDEKRAAVARLKAGETQAKVGADLGVSGNAVGQWLKRFGDSVEAKPAKSTRTKAEKAARAKPKRRAAKKREPKVEPPAEVELDVFAVCEAWSLPYPLALIVHGARQLCDADDFDVLARVEEAVAAHRRGMEARSAA